MTNIGYTDPLETFQQTEDYDIEYDVEKIRVDIMTSYEDNYIYNDHDYNYHNDHNNYDSYYYRETVKHVVKYEDVWNEIKESTEAMQNLYSENFQVLNRLYPHDLDDWYNKLYEK